MHWWIKWFQSSRAVVEEILSDEILPLINKIEQGRGFDTNFADIGLYGGGAADKKGRLWKINKGAPPTAVKTQTKQV